MRVDMWDSEPKPLLLPMKYYGKVASLIANPDEVIIRFCFLNFPYARTLSIENTSDVEGYFYLVPQDVGIFIIHIFNRPFTSFFNYSTLLFVFKRKSDFLRLLSIGIVFSKYIEYIEY